MQPANELQKLCEAWWERLATSTKGEQHRFAEHFLQLLDWNDPSPIAMQALAPQLSTVSYVLRGQGQTAIAAHFIVPGSLDPPSSVVERNLDFCSATRILVNATRALHVRYCFVTDLFRSYLYDAQTDELLLHADSPAEFKSELAEVLDRNEVEHGSLDEVRRQPRSQVARQLREWRRRWADSLEALTHLPEKQIQLGLDRLIVLRYLLDHDILKRPGWRFRQRYEDILALARSGDHKGCGKRLTGLFHDLWFDWKADIFAPDPVLDEALDRDAVTGPLLAEFGLLSRTKFAIPTVLESFNHGDAQEKARVRMIPEDDEERVSVLLKQTPDTVDTLRLEVDIEDEGYRAVFHWFDRMAALYNRLEREFDTAQRSETPPADDLFEWSEQAAGRPEAFSDRFHFAINHGLTIYYASERQLNTVRLLLYLHIISRYEQHKVRFRAFPGIDRALKPRPRFTRTDRGRIFNARPGDEEEQSVM